MIVEFIGSTGSGKTTLLKDVQRRLDQTACVLTSMELVTGLLGLQGVANPTLQNLIQELIGFPFFLLTLRRYKAFLVGSIRMFSRGVGFSINTLSNLRSLERKIGVYEINRRLERGRIILVDEGPILSAHMFVFSGASYSRQEVDEFSGLIPLPDLVVYVKAPVDTLVRRTLQRPDPPREMKSKNRLQAETCARDTVDLFDQIAETDAIRRRLLMVENPDATGQEYAALVDHVSAFILHYQPAGLDKTLLRSGIH